MMHKNSPMIEKLRRDELVISTKLNIADPIIAELAAYAGFDCIWMDMEHCAVDYKEISTAMYAAKARGTEVLVRTPRGAYSNLIRPLEMDATAIMIPHVMNKADAEQVAYYTKFYPLGRRPIDGGNGDAMYCLMDTPEYMRYSNEQKLTIIQIEDIEGYEAIEEIASVPGIDMLFFGPADFAHSLGTLCDLSDPRVEEARKKVAETARRHGKLAGTVGSIANLKTLYDMGYRFVNIGADVVGLGQYYQNLSNQIKEIWR